MLTIRKGDSNEYVTLLQEALIQAGYDCGPHDGIFGRKTKAAVEKYQKDNGLTVDGIVGKQTWTALGLWKDPEPVPDGVQPPNFKQYDSRWGTKMYSNHGDKSQTMKSSGCGPTAMADIVAAWWDSDCTPWTLAQKSMEWGTRTYNSGTSSTFFRKCASLYGASQYKTSSSIDAAISCLADGGLVVCCFGPGTKGKAGYQKFTKGGHYVCIWKWDGSVFSVNDPASSSSARAKATMAEVQNCRKGFYLFWR